ncbi:MAG: hypothetical protein QM402_09810 [Synergistota bacterium]|nr:hypothetical protein [Synergistota bacterium]
MEGCSEVHKLDLKALVYTRPRTKRYFHFIADKLFESDKIIYISEYRSSEPVYLMKSFYAWYNQCLAPQKALSVLPEEEINDIIIRCRFLRSIERSQAMRMIYAMWKAIEQILHECDPDIIIGMPIDSYVLDLMDRVARTQDKPYVEIVQSFIKGYSRFTHRGELVVIREPSDEEVAGVYEQLLKEDYLPAYIRRFQKNPVHLFLKYYLKDKIKRVVFWGRRLASKDPLNFYLNCFAYKEPLACSSLSCIFPHRYFDKDWHARLTSWRGSTKIYIPLQFYPEISIDYWCRNTSFLPWYDTLERILGVLPENVCVCMKEHPAAVGYRPPGFYQKLKNHKNVILVPFDIPSNFLVQLCDVVLTWGNTVGIEARLRHKPVITCGTPYYDVDKCFIKIESAADIEDLPEVMSRISNSGKCDGQEIIRRILSGCFPGKFEPVDFFASDKEKVQEALKVSQSIAMYIGALVRNESIA